MRLRVRTAPIAELVKGDIQLSRPMILPTVLFFSLLPAYELKSVA